MGHEASCCRQNQTSLVVSASDWYNLVSFTQIGYQSSNHVGLLRTASVLPHNQTITHRHLWPCVRLSENCQQEILCHNWQYHFVTTPFPGIHQYLLNNDWLNNVRHRPTRLEWDQVSDVTTIWPHPSLGWLADAWNRYRSRAKVTKELSDSTELSHVGLIRF